MRSILIFCLALMASAAAANEVGFKQFTIPSSERPLEVSVWYPAKPGGKSEIVGENPAFVGLPAVKDATPEEGKHPLVVLSHGYSGSWRNVSWLADALARKGYIAAAPNHPGTTTFNRDAAQAAKLWERPRDLSRVIDVLQAEPQMAGAVDASRIAAIGHSLGGWTALSILGARFDSTRFVDDCKSNVSPRACALRAELGIGESDEGRKTLDEYAGDPRVKAAVSLDAGLMRGFDPAALERLSKPALLIGAGIDVGGLPATLETGYVAEYMPKSTTTYLLIDDAMHFSFMQVCKPDALAFIAKESPGDVVACKDGGTRGRAAIHGEVEKLVTDFLASALPARLRR